MVTVKCLACDAENDPRATGGFCEACGKKLPPASAYRGRGSLAFMTETEATATPTAAGPRQRTAEALFTAAVIRLIAGGLYLVLGPVVLRVPESFLPTVMLGTLAETALFALSGLVARKFPRVGAAAGLAVFAGSAVTVFVLDASAALWGMPLAVIWLAFLIRAAWLSGQDH